MKRLLLAALAALFAAAASAEPPVSGASGQILRHRAGSGGGLSSAPSLLLDGAVGESVVSTASAAGLALQPGLAPLLAQPGTVTSLVAVTKTTGALELAWTAPGLDGFTGSVTAGFYRLDYSSDPLHVFSPETFVTELATSCAPGDPQAVTLTGLLANTTYYARVYLADARKAVAETSAPDADSTLARLPAAPAFSGVFATSVTISWSLPAGGAEGYRLDASTTNFGRLFPGGVVTSSRTADGLVVSLTVTGLSAYTSYYFTVGSLNWQGDTDFNTVIATMTLPGAPVPVTDLASIPDALGRTVLFTWRNPVFANPLEATVVVSTSPISFSPADGASYASGAVQPDGSVIASTAADVSHLQAGLSLDTTAYFKIYSKDSSFSYSVAVSTQIVLDLPPMAPAGLQSALSADGSSVTLTWAPVASNRDGSPFRGGAAAGWELQRYDVYRATGIARAGWTLIGSTSAAAGAYLAALPSPGSVYFYKVVSRDAFPGTGADQAMAADTLGNVYAVSPDLVTRLMVPAAAAPFLTAQGNAAGRPLLVRADERPQDLGGRIVRSLAFDTRTAPDGGSPALLPPQTPFGVDLHYDVVGGQIVPGALGSGARALTPPASSVDAATTLSAYYAGANGDATKLFGRVDPLDQTVHVDAALLGNYQVRTVLRDQAFSFDISGVSNKAITPNGDGLNDTVVFTFDNPRDSAVSGKIFDLRGAFVADMTPGPVAGSSLMWDGKGGGVVVPRGVYIYQIRAEGKAFNGTVVVIR